MDAMHSSLINIESLDVSLDPVVITFSTQPLLYQSLFQMLII